MGATDDVPLLVRHAAIPYEYIKIQFASSTQGLEYQTCLRCQQAGLSWEHKYRGIRLSDSPDDVSQACRNSKVQMGSERLRDGHTPAGQRASIHCT